MRTLVVLLLAGILAAAEEPDKVTRSIDVTQFLQRSSGPRVPDMNSPASSMTRAGMSPEVEASYVGEWLIQFVRGATSELDNSESLLIEYQDGFLLVVGPRALTDRAVAVVDFARRAFGRRVVLDLEAWRFPRGFLASCGAAPGPLPAAVDAKLREATADASRSAPLAVLRAVSLDDQPMVASSLREETFVASYEGLIAPKSASLSPIMAVNRLGAVVEALPHICADSESVFLDFRVAIAQPGPETAFGIREGDAQVQQPSRQLWTWEAAVKVPVGRSTLLFAGAVDGMGEGEVAVLVRVSMGGEVPGDLKLIPGESAIRVTSIGELQAHLRSRPGTRLGANEDDPAGDKDEVLSIPEAQAPILEPEQLMAELERALGGDVFKASGGTCGVMRSSAWVKGSAAELEVGSSALREMSSVHRLAAIESCVVRMEGTAWSAKRSALSEPAARAALVAAALRGDGARVVAMACACGTAGQQFNATTGHERLFVRSRGVDIAEAATVSEPIAGTVRGGFRVAALVRPGTGASRLQVEFEGQFASDTAISAIEEKSPAGPTQSADLRLFESSFQCAGDTGEWLLAGTALREAAGGGQEVLLMFFRVTLPEAR